MKDTFFGHLRITRLEALFMHRNLARNTAINRLSALALLVICLIQPSARAQVQRNDVQLTSWQFGFLPGEKARITVGNKDDLEQPIRAEMKVFDQEGTQIAIRETDILPNGFSYMEVDRDEIPLRGELTSRLQVLVSVRILVRGRTLFSSLSPVSGEIINRVTGRDSIWVDLGSPVLTCPDCRRPVSDGASNTLLLSENCLGLAPDQAGRVSVFNDDPEQPLHAKLTVLDADGSLLAQREIVVPPRRFRYMEVNRLDIARPGETPTGRVQGTFTLTFQGQVSAELPGLSPISLELVQEGKTVALIYQRPAIQKIRGL